MKLYHRVPRSAIRLTEPVGNEYQAEVDKHTARAQQGHERAQSRLKKAELRRQSHSATKARHVADGKLREFQRKLRVLDELVELRREELQQIEAMMKASPSSLVHRGAGCYRPIPQPGGIV